MRETETSSNRLNVAEKRHRRTLLTEIDTEIFCKTNLMKRLPRKVERLIAALYYTRAYLLKGMR
jgi:hypothetical protein